MRMGQEYRFSVFVIIGTEVRQALLYDRTLVHVFRRKSSEGRRRPLRVEKGREGRDL